MNRDVATQALAEIRKILAQARPTTAGTFTTFGADVDAKQWARTLRARHDCGDYLTQVQIDAYRTALRLDRTQPEEGELE